MNESSVWPRSAGQAPPASYRGATIHGTGTVHERVGDETRPMAVPRATTRGVLEQVLPGRPRPWMILIAFGVGLEGDCCFITRSYDIVAPFPLLELADLQQRAGSSQTCPNRRAAS